MIVAGKAAVVRGSPQRVDERIEPVAEAELNIVGRTTRRRRPGCRNRRPQPTTTNLSRSRDWFGWEGDVAVNSTTPPAAVVRVELLLNVLFDALVILVAPNSSAALVEETQPPAGR